MLFVAATAPPRGPLARPPCLPGACKPTAAFSLPRCRLEETSPHGDALFEVAASLRVDMQVGNTEGPYRQAKGDHRFRFSLVYASPEEVLPQVEELCLLAHQGADSKEQRAAAAEQMADMIKVGGCLACWRGMLCGFLLSIGFVVVVRS